MPDTAQFFQFLLELNRLAGEAIAPHFRRLQDVAAKPADGWDPVTEGDRAAERAIRHAIEQHFPDHAIQGEEYGLKPGIGEYSWVLDPIDGTRAFVIGIPTWTTLIGLYRNGKPYMGTMHQPFIGETFLGEPGAAWHIQVGNKTQIKTRSPRPLQQLLAGTTTPHRYDDIPGFETLRKKVQLMRYGGDAYFFSLVAAGQMDLALDQGLQAYDIAALIPIIEGAGGVVTTFTGGDPGQGGDIIAASHPAVLEAAANLLNQSSR